mmetsp:Transcript_74/g.116  ORF Transcript_74/g.116 Transcript_74/m.116 type:complete len:194 (+) Transcript_74:1967-2548(+)
MVRAFFRGRMVKCTKGSGGMMFQRVLEMRHTGTGQNTAVSGRRVKETGKECGPKGTRWLRVGGTRTISMGLLLSSFCAFATGRWTISAWTWARRRAKQANLQVFSLCTTQSTTSGVPPILPRINSLKNSRSNRRACPPQINWTGERLVSGRRKAALKRVSRVNTTLGKAGMEFLCRSVHPRAPLRAVKRPTQQ